MLTAVHTLDVAPSPAVQLQGLDEQVVLFVSPPLTLLSDRVWFAHLRADERI